VSPPPLPVRIPAQGSGVLGATAPFAAVPGTGRDPRRPAAFGSADTWTGWWNPAADRSPPVAATGPATGPTTEPTPIGARPAGYEHPIPAPRPQPAGEPDPAGGRAAPIAWVDPPPTPTPGPDQDPDAAAAPTLVKRVPQASLAPPLRIPPPGHTADTPTALSRYQAGREEPRPAGVNTPTVAVGIADSASDGYDLAHTDDSDSDDSSGDVPRGDDLHSDGSEHDPEHPADDLSLDPAGADRSTPAQDPAQDTARRSPEPGEPAATGPAPGDGPIDDRTGDEPATGRTDGSR
jgi:hypothetical protein